MGFVHIHDARSAPYRRYDTPSPKARGHDPLRTRYWMLALYCPASPSSLSGCISALSSSASRQPRTKMRNTYRAQNRSRIPERISPSGACTRQNATCATRGPCTGVSPAASASACAIACRSGSMAAVSL